mgnify:CR=1 FL=1
MRLVGRLHRRINRQARALQPAGSSNRPVTRGDRRRGREGADRYGHGRRGGGEGEGEGEEDFEEDDEDGAGEGEDEEDPPVPTNAEIRETRLRVREMVECLKL